MCDKHSLDLEKDIGEILQSEGKSVSIEFEKIVQIGCRTTTRDCERRIQYTVRSMKWRRFHISVNCRNQSLAIGNDPRECESVELGGDIPLISMLSFSEI